VQWQSSEGLDWDCRVISHPGREFAESNTSPSLIVIREFVLVLATFLHIVAVASVEEVGAVDLLAKCTWGCNSS